jgi:hypothetical protein
MADLQITGLPALAEAGIQATDVAAVADISATETKKVTIKDLIAAGVALIDDGDIPAAKVGTLSTNQVATAAIQANAVTAAKIASGTITATEIADATITGAKLVNDTVTATQIAANAITASELADNAVDTAAIAANAVTTAKITDANVTYAKLSLSDGDIPGAKIATGGITATQLAANSVAASELADDAVDTAAIVDGAVTAVKIATNTITANQIAANAIGASELADNAVDTAAIADGAVTAAKLSGTLAAASIADDAVTTAKIADDAVTSAKLAANAVDAAALADNAVDSGAIASSAVIEAKIAANAVTVTKIADGTITPAKLNTSNLDRSLNVASGNLGINNTITAATRSGITYNAQGLITGTVALAAGDLPVSTTSAVGGVSIASAGGLAVTGAGALSIAATTTGATATKVTFNNFGQITGTATLAAADLPLATASAVGAVSIASGGPLSVDGNGALTVSNSGVSAGTGTKVTVDAKGIVTALANLADSDLPNHSAALLTSGSIAAARIGNDTIDGTKLSNSSTTIFQSIAQSGYPTAQFSGQLLFDTVSEDAFIWDGTAWQAITTLTKGSLVYGGTFNANTSQMVAATTAGIAAGLTVGSNLPTASANTDGVYVVVSTSGTPSAPAPVVALAPPDYILGVTNTSGSSWHEVDLSQTVAGQVASNITFTPYGQLSSTNVQDALQELETEKLALAGGTVTGQILIGNTGSLVFEGSTIDAYETTITVADPTSSDKTITFPDTTGTVITTGDTGTVTSTMIADGTIVNADINASAAIALTKLANVTSAQIIVGNGSNVPTAVAVTGDIAITNAGVTSIAAGVIVDADISGSAAITGSKIATGTTSAVGVLQLTDSATSTSATTAATPAAVKIAKDAADAAATTANAALPKAGGTMTGNLILDNAKELRLSEGDSDGANYTGLKAQAQSGDITLTLPAVAPTAGQVLKADASTPTTLTWAADSATDSTKMPLAGGTFTGDVTFTGDASDGLWDKSASAFVANLTGNVTGNVSGSAATVTGAAQSAITSLGTLTGLTVDGDLTLTGAANNVVWDKSDNALEFADDAKLKFGSELEIYSTGAASYIKDTGTGNLTFDVDNLIINNAADSATIAKFKEGDACELYFNNGLKFTTSNTGGTVTGTLVSDGLTVDTNTLHVDATNNRVGIKTTSPTEVLDLGQGAQINLKVGSRGFMGQGHSTGATILGHCVKADTTNTVAGQMMVTETNSGGGAPSAIRQESGTIQFHTASSGTADAVFSSERMRIDSSGRLLIGHTTTLVTEGSLQQQIVGTDFGTSGSALLRFQDGTSGPTIAFAHSRNGTKGSHTILADNDEFGKIRFYGSDGTDFNNYGAEIRAVVNGTPGANDMPGALTFGTTADGATGSTERMRITCTGKICQGTTTPRERVHFHYDSSDENYLRFTNSTTGTAGGDGFNVGINSAEQALIWNKENTSMLFGTNGTTALTITNSQNATFAGTVSDSIGDVRKLGYTSTSSAYTLLQSDNGKFIEMGGGGVTAPSGMAAGTMITIINVAASDQTITQGSNFTLTNSADASTGNRTLASKGMATILFTGSANGFISGAGLS